MDRHQSSVLRTPLSSVAAQQRSERRSSRRSYRSCLGAASRLAQTPGLTARRLNTSRKVAKSHDIENVNLEQLSLLVKVEWSLSYVTPLYQFRHTQLKSYARQLLAYIAAEKQQGLAVEVGGTQSGFRISFSVVQGMAVSDYDAETVLIQIHSKQLFAKPDEPLKCVWSGWLTCINGNSEYLSSLPKDFTCLPLFGCRGTENLSSLVKSWFQKTFDCCFGPLEINHTSLQWLVALWTNCHSQSNIHHLKMLWTLQTVPQLQITFTVNPQDAWELWSSVRKDSEEDSEEGEEVGSIDIEEVTRFMQGLKSHFYRHFRLDLSAAMLSHVSTALGSAKFNGKIKISSSRYVITTLTLLTECALLKMPI